MMQLACLLVAAQLGGPAWAEYYVGDMKTRVTADERVTIVTVPGSYSGTRSEDWSGTGFTNGVLRNFSLALSRAGAPAEDLSPLGFRVSFPRQECTLNDPCRVLECFGYSAEVELFDRTGTVLWRRVMAGLVAINARRELVVSTRHQLRAPSKVSAPPRPSVDASWNTPTNHTESWRMRVTLAATDLPPLTFNDHITFEMDANEESRKNLCNGWVRSIPRNRTNTTK